MSDEITLAPDAFALGDCNEVWWPVTVSKPADGGPVEVQIELRYRLMDTDQAKAMRAMDDEQAHEEILDRITDWRGVLGRDGSPLPFSRANLAALMKLPYVGTSAGVGLYQASRGAPVKN